MDWKQKRKIATFSTNKLTLRIWRNGISFILVRTHVLRHSFQYQTIVDVINGQQLGDSSASCLLWIAWKRYHFWPFSSLLARFCQRMPGYSWAVIRSIWAEGSTVLIHGFANRNELLRISIRTYVYRQTDVASHGSGRTTKEFSFSYPISFKDCWILPQYLARKTLNQSEENCCFTILWMFRYNKHLCHKCLKSDHSHSFYRRNWIVSCSTTNISEYIQGVCEKVLIPVVTSLLLKGG